MDPSELPSGPGLQRQRAASVGPARRPIIVRGRLEPLANIPFHDDGPLTRWLMAGRALHPGMEQFIAIHEFRDVPPAHRGYCRPHVHGHDELNVFHTTSRLRVEVLLGDERRLIEAPATVVIPAGLAHAANVISGSGFLVAILLGGEYRATDGGYAPAR